MSTETSKPSLAWLFFSFKGRIARQSYIFSILFFQILFGLIIYNILKAGDDRDLLAIWGLAIFVVGAMALWCSLALSVKRLHDLDLPWYLLVLLFVPMVMWLFIGYLIFMPSKQITNEHGPPPFGN